MHTFSPTYLWYIATHYVLLHLNMCYYCKMSYGVTIRHLLNSKEISTRPQILDNLKELKSQTVVCHSSSLTITKDAAPYHIHVSRCRWKMKKNQLSNWMLESPQYWHKDTFHERLKGININLNGNALVYNSLIAPCEKPRFMSDLAK